MNLDARWVEASDDKRNERVLAADFVARGAGFTIRTNTDVNERRRRRS